MADTNSDRPVDSHSPKIPEQLRKQLVDVDAMYTNGAPSGDGAQPPAQDSSPSNSADPATAPPAAGDGSQPPATPVSSIQSPEDEQTWEQKFKSQQGRFDQMLRANQTLSERVSELQQGMAALHARGLETPPAPAPAAERPKQKYVKDEEVQEYGTEFFDVVGRRAREEIAPEFEELADRLKRLEGRVEGVGSIVTTTVKRGMYETLDHDIPNWKDVNKSPEFKSWLQQPDPYSGRQRFDMLKEAYSGHETARVLSFFKGFLTEATGLPPGSQARSASAPPLAPGNGSGKPSLEDFAAPGRASSSPQTMPPEKPVYTQAWIAKFYAEKLAGKYRGRDADVAATEADIFQAQHEGRIH